MSPQKDHNEEKWLGCLNSKRLYEDISSRNAEDIQASSSTESPASLQHTSLPPSTCPIRSTSDTTLSVHLTRAAHSTWCLKGSRFASGGEHPGLEPPKVGFVGLHHKNQPKGVAKPSAVECSTAWGVPLSTWRPPSRFRPAIRSH